MNPQSYQAPSLYPDPQHQGAGQFLAGQQSPVVGQQGTPPSYVNAAVISPAADATNPSAPPSTIRLDAPVAEVQASLPLHESDATQVQGIAANVSEESEEALDEEWVIKAKLVVLQTKHDPYMQSKEISKLKAAYLKARYNKDIKVIEE